MTITDSNVSPPPTFDDVSYCFVIDPESPSYLFDGLARFVRPSDSDDYFGRQFGLSVRLPSHWNVPAFGNTISHVVCLRPEEEMGWINT